MGARDIVAFPLGERARGVEEGPGERDREERKCEEDSDIKIARQLTANQ